jgi:hypothetical protein
MMTGWRLNIWQRCVSVEKTKRILLCQYASKEINEHDEILAAYDEYDRIAY